MKRILGGLAAIVLIVALTFPFGDMQGHTHWQKVTWIPFTGIVRLTDLAGNVALYLPWGICWGVGRERWRIAACLITAVLLSTAMEYAQVWSHWRFPSATDVTMNVSGAALGLMIGAWARRATSRRQPQAGS